MLRDNEEIFNDIKAHALERLENVSNPYGADLHHELFNMDYFVIYHYEAEKIAKRWGVDAFDLVKYNVNEEQDAFGECYWIKEPNKLNWESQVNLAAYWIGRDLLYEVQEALDSCWDDEMTEEDVKRVKEAIEELEY
tara:strand:+ start:98 stop:508 length:411 start_codon:yes stop_codon:yes gene_type:complete